MTQITRAMKINGVLSENSFRVQNKKWATYASSGWAVNKSDPSSSTELQQKRVKICQPDITSWSVMKIKYLATENWKIKNECGRLRKMSTYTQNFSITPTESPQNGSCNDWILDCHNLNKTLFVSTKY